MTPRDVPTIRTSEKRMSRVTITRGRLMNPLLLEGWWGVSEAEAL